MKTPKQINDGGSVTADIISERYVAGIGMLEEKVKSVGGLSVRDYFAAAALQGLIQASAMPMFDDNGKNHGMPSDSAHDAIINGPGASYPQSNSTSSSLAWVAYGFADAMLEARKEGA
jgi:hypothetical protein